MVVRGSSCLCPVPRAWPGLVLLLFVGERGVSGQRAACAQPALHVANTRQKAAACAATSTLLAWTAYLYIFTFFIHLCTCFPLAPKAAGGLKCWGCSVCAWRRSKHCAILPGAGRASSALTCFQGAPSQSAAAAAQQLHLPSLYQNLLLCAGERQLLSCMSGHTLPIAAHSACTAAMRQCQLALLQ